MQKVLEIKETTYNNRTILQQNTTIIKLYETKYSNKDQRSRNKNNTTTTKMDSQKFLTKYNEKMFDGFLTYIMFLLKLIRGVNTIVIM